VVPAPSVLGSLKSRVWIATECDHSLIGLYAKWGAAEAAAKSRPGGRVHGFAPVAEARGYIEGMRIEAPDRRQ
jgi:hypothetical protein